MQEVLATFSHELAEHHPPRTVDTGFERPDSEGVPGLKLGNPEPDRWAGHRVRRIIQLPRRLTEMNLVLIETTANQEFIFAANKLRENVGASELTARVGTLFVLEAVQAVGGTIPPDNSDPTSYPAISDQNPVEVILAVSGKALLLVRDAKIGRQIVHSVTLQALREAPGLDVRGVVSRDFECETTLLHPLIGELHREFEGVRSRLPGPAARFQRLPTIAECASSGLPAQRVATPHDGLSKDECREYSAQTFAKLQVRKQWKNRLDSILTRHDSNANLPDATTDLEELGCDWLAIVHADGNGLGQVFLNFDREANTTGTRDYIHKLRSFSLALDNCTEKAFCRSLAVLRPKWNFAPIVPLVLGGDDLTVVCDGRQALQFTKKFIVCFEEETRKHPAINSILKNGVTSSAGVAIVKPRFPFFAGYQLAKELSKSAKGLKPRSAIDYHIHYDSSGPDLEHIRRELTIGSARLIARPYAVRPESAPPHRSWSDLQRRIDAVLAQDEEEQRRLLPNSMLHEMRMSLYLGQDAAESQLALVRNRYSPHIDPLLVDDRLFWMEGEQHLTGLLDAVDTAEFWEALHE